MNRLAIAVVLSIASTAPAGAQQFGPPNPNLRGPVWVVPAPGYQQPQQFQPQQFQLPQPPPAQPLQWGQPHQPRPCIIQGPMTC